MIAVVLSLQFTACTGSQTNEDAEFIENADVDKIESTTEDLGEISDSAATLDNSLEEALGETQSSVAQSTDQASTEIVDTAQSAVADQVAQVDTSSAPQLDEQALNDVPPPPPPEISAVADSNEVNLDKVLSENTNSLTDSANAAVDQTTNQANTALNDVAQEATSTMNNAVQDVTNTVPPADQVQPSLTSQAVEEAPAPVVVKSTSKKSVVKMSEQSPYAFNDGFVNTVYFVRPKEKLKDISQKIYGADKTKELKQINKFLKARQPRAGDQILYVSPNRPTDSSRMISYFEDNGMVPETYVAQKGDNLKKVSKKLLGYEKAWQEVWITNSIDSQSKLNEGETIKFWKSTESIAAKPAAPTTPSEGANVITSTQELPSAPPAPDMAAQDTSSLPPPPGSELPPPPAPDQMAMNNELPPPPADPGSDANLPPPPADDMAAQSDLPPAPPADEEVKPDDVAATTSGEMIDEEGEGTALDSNTYAMLGLVVILLAALALVIMRKKKKAAEAAAASQFNETIGT